MFQILCLINLASTAFALKKTIQGFDYAKHELLKDLAENGNLAESLIDIILEQGMTIKAMEKKMNNMEEKINSMEKKMNNMEKKMSTITETNHQKGEQIMAMQERISDLETIIEKQNIELTDMEKDVSDNKNMKILPNKDGQRLGILRNGLKRVQKRTVTQVAFSTYLSHHMYHLTVGHVIKPDQIFINDGNGYNKNTGIFTVPTSGVYLLTCTIDNYSSNPLEVKIVVDSTNMGYLKAFNQIASKTIITRLTAGQTVWLETSNFADAGVYSTTFNKFTTFSGVLLY